MKYWILSPNVYNDETESDWKTVIYKLKRAFIGYDDQHQYGGLFKNAIKLGDVILIAQGQNSNKRFFLCGIVGSEAIREELPDTPGIAQNRRLLFVLKKKEIDQLNLDFNDSTWGESKQPAALYHLKPGSNTKDKLIVEKLSQALSSQKHMQTMQQIINLLEFKKQIILQGPPGTGKTKLAKEIANELTKERKLGSPFQKIDNFFKNFDDSSPALLSERNRINHLLNIFHDKFPASELADLSLDNYAIGTGSNDSFCWWIERGLKSLGYYFPGSARSYLIYWSKGKSDYSKHGKLLNTTADLEEAMKKAASVISDLIINKNFDEANKYFGDGFLLKLLHSYYPNEFMPINSVPCLNNALKVLGIDHAKLTSLEKNLKIQEVFDQKKAEVKKDISNYDFMRFLFNEFDLKGNISFDANEIVSKGEYKLIQFHPAYSYEDFVRGIVVETNNSSQIEYNVENKVLAEFAVNALNNTSANYVLIIDEINRANLPSVLGELIYALEYRGQAVESMYGIDGDNTLTLPPNLYIIGTMNTADRSVGHIDYAIRRRFAFVDVLPSMDVLEGVIKDNEVREMAKILYKSVAGLFTDENLAPDFKAAEVQLGHSYFLAESQKELMLKLDFEIKPLLREYLKDGILLDQINGNKTVDIINGMNLHV